MTSDTDQILEQFTEWGDANIKDVAGHKRMGVKAFNDLVGNANHELRMITNNESDYTSFVCGIAAGIKVMTLNTNED